MVRFGSPYGSAKQFYQNGIFLDKEAWLERKSRLLSIANEPTVKSPMIYS
jgi:hypothetical protein